MTLNFNPINALSNIYFKYCMYYQRLLKSLGFCFLLVSQNTIYAAVEKITETKQALKHVETQIQSLQQSLTQAKNKNDFLRQTLAQADKNIGISVQNIHQTQIKITQKKRQVDNLEGNISKLHNQLLEQQKLLAQHIKTRYSMGRDETLQWLLNQNNPADTSRSLTLYQYILQSRQKLIHQISETKNTLEIEKTQLSNELATLEHLKESLIQAQQKLVHEKEYNKAIVTTLLQQIKTKQQTLNEFQQNKTNLSALLQSLTHYSASSRMQAIRFTHATLIRPVDVHREYIKNINQGVLFIAREGLPIHAVSTGTVVFSDWLRGYGLLLIIDHGHGFMSLYAHNQSLFKRKGETVQQGEQIATVGHSGGLKENGLYFEIRQRGKAIPPQKWLS